MPYAPNIVFRMRWMIGIALLAIAAIPVALSRPAAELPATGAAPAAAATLPSINPALADLAAREPGKRVEVIVQLDAGTTRAAAAPLVREAGGKVTRDLHIINAVAAELPAAGAAELASRPEIRAVSPNGAIEPEGRRRRPGDELQPLDPGAAPVEQLPRHRPRGGRRRRRHRHRRRPPGLPRLLHRQALARHRLGGREPGRHHAERHLRPRHARRGHHRRRLDRPRRRRPAQGQVHGSGARRQPRLDQGLRRPGQRQRPRRDRRHPVRRRPQGRVQHPRPQPVARVDGRRVLQDRPARRGRRGRLVQGHLRGRRRRQPRPGGDAVSYAPGNDPYIVTVGAVDDNGTHEIGDDTPTSWSSRGTTQDGFSKPDIYAPGAKIVSNLAPGSTYAGLCGDA